MQMTFQSVSPSSIIASLTGPYLRNRARTEHLVADFDRIDRVVVADEARIGRRVRWILPRLRERAVVEAHVAPFVLAQLAVLCVCLIGLYGSPVAISNFAW